MRYPLELIDYLLAAMGANVVILVALPTPVLPRLLAHRLLVPTFRLDSPSNRGH